MYSPCKPAAVRLKVRSTDGISQMPKRKVHADDDDDVPPIVLPELHLGLIIE